MSNEVLLFMGDNGTRGETHAFDEIVSQSEALPWRCICKLKRDLSSNHLDETP